MHVRRAGNRALAGGGAARENALAGAGGPLSPQQRAHSHAAGLRLSLSDLSLSLSDLSRLNNERTVMLQVSDCLSLRKKKTITSNKKNYSYM